MAPIDTRSLSDDALEALRTRAVAMHEVGNTQVSIALALGVHQNTISRWLKTFRSVGASGLKRQKRGRRLRWSADLLLELAEAFIKFGPRHGFGQTDQWVLHIDDRIEPFAEEIGVGMARTDGLHRKTPKSRA